MRQIRLPGTDLSVSRLSFGTSRLHRMFTWRQRVDLIRLAIDLGFTHFDTAPLYGFGIAEHCLGLALRHEPHVTIASKVGLYPPFRTGNTFRVWSWKVWNRATGGAAWSPAFNGLLRIAQESLDRTLRDLRRECVDILLLHDPEPGRLEVEAWVEWLQRQKEVGKIRYWGVTGEACRVIGFLDTPLACLLQVRDPGRLEESWRSKVQPHFVYGVLSSRGGRPVEDVLSAALRGNPNSCIIVSSCNARHIRQLVRIAESS